MHVWGMGMDIGPPIPIPTFHTLPPSLPISPFGENGDGGVLGGALPITIPIFPVFPVSPTFPLSPSFPFDMFNYNLHTIKTQNPS